MVVNLAFGPAHCGTCHVPADKFKAVEAGLQVPLSGGWELEIPPGTFRAPNLTPDVETGIGSWSDAEIARALRHSVKKDGCIMFPFMPFQELSDEDLTGNSGEVDHLFSVQTNHRFSVQTDHLIF